MACLVWRISGRSTRASCRATASASLRSWPSGTTRLISPICRASAALTLSRPSRMISLAFLGPTIQGSSRQTMPAPKRSSGSPKRAFSEAMVISQAIASSQAPARAGPCTAATVGFSRCQKAMQASKSRCSTGRQASTPCGGSSAWALRSKPLENALPAPVSTTAWTASSPAARAAAALSSSNISWSMALSRSGRFSVISATARSTV